MAEKRVSVCLVAEGGRQVRAELEGIGDAGAREPPRIFWRPISPCYATISNVFKFA